LTAELLIDRRGSARYEYVDREAIRDGVFDARSRLIAIAQASDIELFEKQWGNRL
jgi:hypothetical protein